MLQVWYEPRSGERGIENISSELHVEVDVDLIIRSKLKTERVSSKSCKLREEFI